MILTVVAFLLAAIALGTMVWLLVRHWKDIRLLDPLSIKEERERQNRAAMIERRFDRIHTDQLEALKRAGRHLSRMTGDLYQSAHDRLHAFTSLYQNVKSPFSTLAPTTRDQIKTLMGEARSLARDLKFGEAERRYIEVLSHDARNADAYKGLGQIYLKQKLFPQAKETFEFVQRMKKADDATYAGLAEIAEAEGDFAKAEAMRLKAVEVSPRQAFRHAELAQFYLGQKQPAKASPSAKRASDLEPGSAKYLELSLEAAILLRDFREAQKRYDRLRLLSDDSAKIQSWREKMEEMQKGKKMF